MNKTVWLVFMKSFGQDGIVLSAFLTETLARDAITREANQYRINNRGNGNPPYMWTSEIIVKGILDEFV